MDPASMHRKATENVSTTLRGVDDDQWTAQTPCEDWDVRALVNHLTNELLWMPPLLDGLTVEDVGDRFDGDVLGEDPISAWDKAATDAIVAVDTTDPDKEIHLSGRDVPAHVYVTEVFADLTIHGWDLARAVGSDEEIDADALDAIEDWFAEHETEWRKYGVIGERPDISADAGKQARVLAMFGRKS